MNHSSHSYCYTWEGAVSWLRNQPQFRDLVLDAYYDDPLLSSASRYFQSSEWRAIKEYLPMNRGSALDVGAGRGIASYALAMEGFRVVSLEPDESPLVGTAAIQSIIDETQLDISIVQDLSEKLPFNDNSFDLVFARALLHHSTNIDSTCSEFFRVLKPGGVLCVVREHVISRRSHLQAFLDAHPLHSLYGGENAYLLSDYKHAITNSGLQLNLVLSPLQSVINFAPYDLITLRKEISRRIFGTSFLARLLYLFISIPVFWAILRPFFSFLDNRPGRLYSFVASK